MVNFGNTLEAFAKAIELGAPMLELDVRRTADRQLVVFHDAHIAERHISDLTYARLIGITSADGYQVPTLEEVLKLAQGRIRLDIELKEPGYEAEIIDLVRQYFTHDGFVMKSFYDSIVRRVKELDPRIKTGLLLGRPRPHRVIRTRLSELFPEWRLWRSKADFVSPNYLLLQFGFYWRMKMVRKPIYVWTVNDQKLMRRLLRKPIAALITDRPDVAMELLTKVNVKRLFRRTKRP